MAEGERFCAICERRLGKKDSEHVCRECFHRAREPKKVEMIIDERQAATIGLAYAIGDFINWGAQKLIEKIGTLPPAKGDDAIEARKKLKEIQDRINRKLDAEGKDPDGGPDLNPPI